MLKIKRKKKEVQDQLKLKGEIRKNIRSRDFKTERNTTMMKVILEGKEWKQEKR